MELSFVIAALRRRFWVVTLFALLGSLPGLRGPHNTGTTYESTAVLNIQPPTKATVNVFNVNPDRYVQSQISVLKSETLAAQVAAKVTAEKAEVSVTDLKTMVKIEAVPTTDIVEITTTADDPDKAQIISHEYAQLYVDTLATTDSDTQQRQNLDAQIAAKKADLAAADDRLAKAMAPYIRGSIGKVNPDPIPPIEAVDPADVSLRQSLLGELADLTRQRNDIEIQSRLKVNTAIIQDAPFPEEPKPPRGNFLLAGGLAAGAVLGVIVALLWARFSTKVLDESTASDILGSPIVSEVPHYRSLSRNPLAAFQSLPRSAIPVVDQLCVRAEAMARIGEPLVVVVTGTMRSAGSSTLALALSERFAAGGASVVLIDGDVRDPRITALFNATADGGVPSVIVNDGAVTDSRGRSAFTRTMDPAVSVLGLGPNRGSAALRRDTVPAVLAAAKRKAEIVVVDGGPVLDLASTLHFASLADAVVLAVPLARQKADALLDLARQLDPVRSKLLPVVTSPSRRSARGEVVGSDGTIVMPSAGGPSSFAGGRPVVATDVPGGSGLPASPSGVPAAPSVPGGNGGSSQPGAATTVVDENRAWDAGGPVATNGVAGGNGGGPARPMDPGWKQPPS